MSHHSRINPWRLGFALGLAWAIGLLLVGWAGCCWEYGEAFIRAMSSVYIGYKATGLGAVAGAIWGFIDFFIFGALIAVIYNRCFGPCDGEKKTKKAKKK